ncbi:MAG: hypothetical protein JW910_02845, partial [Anaerolineae bacterium]|nr:hypothetical protein [Anaerolineae bacterium]
PEMPLTVPVVLAPGEAELSVELAVYYCEAVNESLCFVERVRVHAPVTVSADGGEAALLVEHAVSLPEVPAS